MKVLIPVWGFGKSGGYRVLSKLADELISHDVEVNFVCFANSAGIYFPTKAQIYWVNKNGMSTAKENGKAASFQGHLFSLMRAIKKLDNKNKYDIIFANQSLTVFPALLAGLKEKVVYYIQAYEPEYYHSFHGFKNYVLAKMSAWTYRLGLFSIVNADIYTNYKDIRSDKVLYPGIDFDIFYPKQAKQIKKEKIILGTIGRNEAFKGTAKIKEAFIKLKKLYPDLELHVAFGDNEQFKEMMDVKIIIPKNDAELSNYYRSLDFYLCAGMIQLGAFHYPTVESMSCKTSVITTPYFPADVSNAYLVSPKNAIDDIVKGFQYALENSSVREEKTEKAYHDVKNLTWKNTGEKLYKYLQEKLNSQQK